MSGGYRITVRGIMSERFCQGFCGLSRRADAGRTILTGHPPTAPALHDMLATLDNLGVEVVGVEPSPGTTAHTTLEAR